MNQGWSSRKLWLALLLLITIAGFFGAAGFVVQAALSPYEKSSTRKEIFEVQKGMSPMQIGRQLEARGMIRSAQLFYWVGKFRGDWSRVKAGEYEVSSSMSPIRILDSITSGVSVLRPLLVREGENMYEVAVRVEEKGWGPATRFLALAKDPRFIAGLQLGEPAPGTLEGFLFPDTYHFTRKATHEEILRTMVKRFLSVWGPNEEQRARQLGMSRYQVLTLASIVEKETGAADERPVIAGVFHNRLRKRMRLQSDPTTIYGMWARYKGNIRRSDLLENTPFNTYVIPALPIGPISNPGIEAIQATLNPAEHHYLYFVSHNDGTHEFTATYEDHLRAVKSYQLDARARTGKSWRDLRKSGQIPNPSPNGSSPNAGR